MTLKSCDYTDAMENALLTAENHGDAYRMLEKSGDFDRCRAELRAFLEKHHGSNSSNSVTRTEADTIIQDVMTQWILDCQCRPFLDELKLLLLDYRATISWDCGNGSDLHGVCDQRMTIEVFGRDALVIEGDCIDADDIP